MSIRNVVGLSLLAVQVVMIGAAQFHPMRYFCWAPYDSQNEYRIHALVDDNVLDAAQIESRYRLPMTGVNPRMIYQVTDIISYIERAHHEADPAQVTVTYSTNGGPEQRWDWPLP